METIKSDNPESIGSVKAAISLFGERINGKKQEKNKNQEVIAKKIEVESSFFCSYILVLPSTVL
jgi:hypothetical protein